MKRVAYGVAAAAVFATVAVTHHRQHTTLPTIRGAVNPAVTQHTIYRTVCVHGWTRTIRPPVSYTQRLKEQQVGKDHLRDYEEDHLIPLEIGGSPWSTRNLWAEPWAQADRSDPVENRLHVLLCSGAITLAEARHRIVDYKLRHG